jgi:hypothetical protein
VLSARLRPQELLVVVDDLRVSATSASRPVQTGGEDVVKPNSTIMLISHWVRGIWGYQPPDCELSKKKYAHGSHLFLEVLEAPMLHQSR